MNRILITGSNSFIGANYIKYSENKEIRVVSLVENKSDEIDFREIEVVLHLAAIVHQSKIISEKEYFRVNTDLCIEVATNAKRAGVRQFIFLSTLKVYGTFINGSELRNENSECYPDDAYGKSKHAAEISLMKMQDENFIVSIVRTPLVYGEGVKANLYKLIRMIDTFPFLPFGMIDNKRNFTFVQNLVAFIDKIIEKKARGIFIAMDIKALSTTELIEYISMSLGKKIYLFQMSGLLLSIFKILFSANFERLFESMEVNNSETRRILEFAPPYSTEEGINKTVKHYLHSKNPTLY